MERLIRHVLDELAIEFEVAFVGPRGSEPYATAALGMSLCALSPVPRFLWECQLKSLQLARRFRPDLVLAGSGATAPAAMVAASHTGAAAACYAHGLDLIAPSALYRSIFLPAIRRCSRIIVNSRHTGTLAQRAGVVTERIRTLHPGVDIPKEQTDVADFFEFAGIARDRAILLSVGRLVPRKGLPEFVERVLPRVVARRPDCILVVIGSEPTLAVRHRGGELHRLEQAAAASGMVGHVRVLGSVDDTRLRQAYAAARLLVFPLRRIPGDVEGFGMVAVEAAAHGLPTAAFAQGGVSDAVREGVSGYLIAPDDDEAFARTVLNHLEQTDRKWQQACVEFAADFAWPRFGERLRQICREAIADRHDSESVVPHSR